MTGSVGDSLCASGLCPELWKGASLVSSSQAPGSGQAGHFLCLERVLLVLRKSPEPLTSWSSPERSYSVGPARGWTHSASLWRQPLEAARPLTSAATPHPLLLPALQVSVDPGQRKSPFLLWPEERSQGLAKQPSVSWTRRRNKTERKTKSSIRSLSYPEASHCSSQVSQPGLCHLLSPRNGPAQVGGLMGAGAGGA